jgi:cytochrome c5
MSYERETVADLPRCPNVKAGVCERSQLRLMGETSTSYLFTCATCHLLWAVSRPKTVDEARWRNQMEKVQKASARERELAQRPKVFDYGRRSVTA